MNRRFSTLTPMQCLVLSHLAPLGTEGISCTQLSKHAGVSRASLYVLVRRLDKDKLVRRRHVQVAGRPERQVVYAITAAGLKARARYARDLGLRT